MMNPQLLDHLFVVIVLVIVFPFGGLWAYRRFLARVAAGDESALVTEYRLTLVWLAGLLVATLVAWFAAERDMAALGFAPLRITDDNGWVLGIAGGAAAGLLIRPILALANRRVATALARQFEKLAPFLPKTNRQLAWGLLVSIAAGIAEEVAYRGYLQPYFATWLPEWGAIAAASVLFGFAHLYQGWSGVLLTTFLGVGLGAIYAATGSLLLPILLHAAIDISSMVTARLVLARS